MFRIEINNVGQNYRFLFQGPSGAMMELVACIEGKGGRIGIASPEPNDRLPLLLVPNTLPDEGFPENRSAPWLAWNRNNLEHLHDRAQDQGALCVLPAKLSAVGLFNALQTAAVILRATPTESPNAPGLKRNFDKGEQIHLEEDRVVQIRRGVVRCTSIHPDGDEVLIGFYGEGDVLLAHTHYGCHAHNCHVEMRAHTSLSVTIEPWQTAVARPDFYDRLKQRICQMELWSSVQARPTAEDRLLGMLQVIGGRFSQETKQGAILSIRLTHEQLAGAVGATRTTVTRLLGNLRKKGLLQTTKTPMGEFFILIKGPVHCHH